MDAPDSPTTGPAGQRAAEFVQPAWLRRWPELPFLLPLVVFWIGTFCEPKPPVAPADAADESAAVEGWIAYRHYPVVYSVKIALVAAAIAVSWPAYRPVGFPHAATGLAVGVAGAAIWIGLVELGLEQRVLGPLGLEWLLGLGQRSAFNPLVEMAQDPLGKYLFLAMRFFGLVLVVPVMEEFFLRGFLMRFVMHPNWTQIPIGQVSPLAVAAGTLVPMLMHPSELLAAAAWFSLVTWLLIRSRSVWTCVLAHAVTNLLMGLYVLATGHWYFM